MKQNAMELLWVFSILACVLPFPSTSTVLVDDVTAGLAQAAKAHRSLLAEPSIYDGVTPSSQPPSQMSAAEVAAQLSNLEGQQQSTAAPPSMSGMLQTVQQLTSIAAVPDIDMAARDRVKNVASSLLGTIAAASANDTTATSSAVVVLNGVGALWKLAGADSRAQALSSIDQLSAKLAGQQLAAADAQPVMNLFANILDGAMDLVNASAASTGDASSTAARQQAARHVLASVTDGAAAAMHGLLNAVPVNSSDSVVLFTTRLYAAIQHTTSNLSSPGITLSLPAPDPEQPAAARRHHRRLLSSTYVFFAPVTVVLNSDVGALCAADPPCSAASGVGFTVTVFSDLSLLAAALGGSLAPLAAGFPDYRKDGSVQIVSPIVRVAAPGIPSSAVGAGTNLVALSLPVNISVLQGDDTTVKRVIVRLQDFVAASVDISAGIYAGPSNTTTNTSGTPYDNQISGYSDSLGDFLVIQYESTAPAVPIFWGAAGFTTTGRNSAGPIPVPSSLLMSVLLWAAIFTAALLI